MKTLTRTADFANAAFLNELERLWHDEPTSYDSSAAALLAGPQEPRITGAIREAFTPLDSYPITTQPVRDGENAPVLSVRQAGG